MTVCGIVAEYNPFHAGHAHHIVQTRRALGADTAIVCAMSGNFVQRGDLAVMEKYARAEAAVRCGADLVLETPLAACLSSAEGFARGAAALLDALGSVSHLSFGAEQADLALLQQAADLSLRQSEALRQGLAAGLPYAAAMQQAVSAADPEAGALLASPNNTLGVEYLRALAARGSRMQPLAIERKGGAHDSDTPADGLPSASYLRGLLADGDIEACRPLMPEASFAVLGREIQSGAAPVTRSAVDLAVLAHLRRLDVAALLPFCSRDDGLAHRLADAIRDNASFSAVCTAAQTRRYPHARVARPAAVRAARAAVYPRARHRQAGTGAPTPHERYLRPAGHHQAGHRAQSPRKFAACSCARRACGRPVHPRLSRARPARRR